MATCMNKKESAQAPAMLSCPVSARIFSIYNIYIIYNIYNIYNKSVISAREGRIMSGR